ncbi:DUF2846 domain-containing protein [Rhodoferax sp.]|uniref:DUF2846 domain-containing protein n=1 Tax=Rhodoferax sp. TaxID=50421 RepID=UPI0026083770|nr:DUF2846 domain-containing protein [Rhodoferax sp.]MDD2918797.1 DUF2846 domain-containing protein [Rhodoferax sp.]
MKPYIAALFAGLTLVGCASVPMADARREAAIKTFTIAPEQAGIFIYLSEFIGTAVKLDVWLDGAHLGQTVSKTFLYKAVAPGKHTITSIGENTETLEVEIIPGSFAYVRQEAKMGTFRARTKLHLMDEAEGRQGVLTTRLAQNFPLTQELEVRVVAEDPDWRGPLTCEAANSFGKWPFTAPGTVTVEPSASPLTITCQTLDGAAVAAMGAAPVQQPTPHDSARQGAATGAKVGSGVGVALGVAAAPVMGPAFAVLLALGSAFRGAEIGGVVGAVTSGDRVAYPNPIEVHVQRIALTD